jgi:hypothetical protein
VKYKSVYHAAMSDCLTKPKVKKVELAGYRGHQGNVISILAWDKFRVETVSVMILNKMGQLIEKGPAVARMYSGNREWDYIATRRMLIINPAGFLSRSKIGQEM